MEKIIERNIAEKCRALTNVDLDYWSFRGRSKRSHCHAFIQYPAMMVPQMQGELIDIILSNKPSIKNVFDPFVGSGTILGECMSRGLNFSGIDINPLAILACETKADPFFIKSLEKKIVELKNYIQSDNSSMIDHYFENMDKWFIKRVQISLCKIKRGISQISEKWARRFFWVALSDTVRSVCNSRSSTYKLHIKSCEDFEKVKDPVVIFFEKLERNFNLKIEQKKLLKNTLTRNSHYSGNIKLHVGNILDKPNVLAPESMDLLITSPPYGDNSTTVTYGQFSYLPLMWIDLNDLHNRPDLTLLKNASAIDSASLGGSLKSSLEKVDGLRELSQSFSRTINKFSQDDTHGMQRLSAFINDLELSLGNILLYMKKGSYLVWTLGNRRISGIEIPLNIILKELLESYGCEFICEINRSIPSKRMAIRNKNVSTMSSENVLLLRKI